MKNVLVTGAQGFLGQHCVPALVARGFTVHAVSRSPRSATSPEVNWHQLDLLEEHSKLDELLTSIRPTHLLHLAWVTTHGQYWTSPLNLHWVACSLALLRAFVAAGGKRVVVAGTCAEYDWSSGFCVEGETPLAPSTLYGVCKNSIRQIVESFSRQSGFSSAWGRFFFLHGPQESPQRLVPSIIHSLHKGEMPRVTYPGDLRDFLYSVDAAEALVALLDSEVQGAVNIASGEPISLGTIARTIAEILNRPDLILGEDQTTSSQTPRLVAAANRLRNEVGWIPRHNVLQGLERTARWWQAEYSVRAS